MCAVKFAELLTHSLPVTGIESEAVARVVANDLNETVLEFRQPLAGESEMYVNPFQALKFVRAASEWDNTSFDDRVALHLIGDLPFAARPGLSGITGHSGTCVPVREVINVAKGYGRISRDVLNFVDSAATAAMTHPYFFGPGLDASFEQPVSVEKLPQLPPPHALMEGEAGPLWDIAWLASTDGNTPNLDAVANWLAFRRGKIAELGRKMGTRIYGFDNAAEDYGDDFLHRNLCLDLQCHVLPNSPLIAYLLRATNSDSLAAFREALLKPDAFHLPWAASWGAIDSGAMALIRWDGPWQA